MKKCEVIYKWKQIVNVQTSFPEPIKLINSDVVGGFDILGTPIGTKDFCEKYVRENVFKDLKKGISVISRIEDPQVAVHILRSCLSFGKLVHVLRSVPPAFLIDICHEYNIILRAAFSTITGISLHKKTLVQFSRSISRGGLGFRDPSKFSYIAYFASVANACTRDDIKLCDVEDIENTIDFINSNVVKHDNIQFTVWSKFKIKWGLLFWTILV